jgi:hypothetical protein
MRSDQETDAMGRDREGEEKQSTPASKSWRCSTFPLRYLVKNAAIGIRLPGHGVQAADMQPWEGSPDALADRLGAFLEQDVDHVVVWLDPNTEAGIEALADVLARI